MRRDLALTNQRVQARDLALVVRNLRRVVQLAGREVEPALPQLLLGLAQPIGQRLVGELSQLMRFRHALFLTHDETGLHRQLVNRESHRFAGDRLGHARELEQDPARLHDRNPLLGVALAGAHARLRRLLRDGLVGEDVDPHLPTTLDVTGHRDTSRFDLAVREPARLERLNAELTERQARPTLGHPGLPTSLHLPVTSLARHQHDET